MYPPNKEWPVGPTGRYLVGLREGPQAKARLFREIAGVEVASRADS